MRFNVWIANLIVFIASFCTLVLELVAGRLLAPYIGVSLYTWTSIIGVVLAGISLGNYLGGKIADRFPSQTTLGVLLVISGLTALAVNPVAQWTTAFNWTVPLIAKIVLVTTLIFFLPCLILGTISPVVVKLTLQDLGRTGQEIGRLYAVSTLGSIVGTFATGFWLVPSFGTRAITWGVAVVLLASAALFGGLWRRKVQFLSILLGLVVITYAGTKFAQDRGAFASPCDRETSYFCIRVGEAEANGRALLTLVLDHLIHSYVDPSDPTYLQYDYEKIYAEVAAFIADEKSTVNALFIGGGGYTFPRYLEALYPGSQLDVIEIDPEVTAIVHEKMGLPLTTTIRTFNQDARIFLKENDLPPVYDLVLGDAFNDLSVPYHLTTKEFASRIKQLLRPDGFYLVNVIDNYQKGEFLKAFVNTLGEVFTYVNVLAPVEGWTYDAPMTFIIAASDRPLSREDLRVSRPDLSQKLVAHFTPAAELERWRNSGRRLLLTDDFAPVDNLVAPLFVDRGF